MGEGRPRGEVLHTTGAQNYGNPRFGDAAATMCFCGDDAEAKATVKGLGPGIAFKLLRR